MTITDTALATIDIAADRAARLTAAGTAWGTRIAADTSNAQLTYRVNGALRALKADKLSAVATREVALNLIADRPPQEPTPPAEIRPRLVAVPDADPTDDEVDAEDADVVEIVEVVEVVDVHETSDDAVEPAADAKPAKKAPARKPKARRGRASVPSWDEILFGATHTDE